MQHEIYMQRAIQLAKRGLGNTYPNPMVGCVIVHYNKIIGEGWHQKAGKAHAEINALRSVKDKQLLQNSTLYVTLEPCSHFGKTPPCANKIASLGIPRVVIGSLDINEKVNGKGIKILENAGIEVITKVLEKECQDLNKRFFTFHLKKRPYIILKWAQSSDGFLDFNFQKTIISNKIAHQISHQMRADEQAILIGKNTAITDNPELTVRETSGNNPIRILLDKDLTVAPTSKIYNSEAPTLVFNFKKEKQEGNIHFISLEKEKDFLEQVMEKLYSLEIQSVIVEGGAATINSFLAKNLWDEIWLFENENLKLHSGTKAPQPPKNLVETIPLRDNILKKYKNNNFGV